MPQATPPPTTEAITGALEDALAGLDEDVSVEEAIQILNLLQELRQTQRVRTSGSGGTSGPDY
jgi:hypothetical protein